MTIFSGAARQTCIYTAFLLASVMISGCGSSSGSSSAPNVTDEQSDTRGGLTSPSDTQTKTGSFVDSPVSGISYRTQTYTGLTDNEGTFQYLDNEIIEFSIGEIILGAAIADSTVTPLELGTLIGTLRDGALDYQNNHQDRATNTLRFLQTLDSDSYPDNGISISSTTRSALENLDADAINFNLEESKFESQQPLVKLVSLTTNTGELVSSEQAVEHFKTTLDSLNIHENTF